MATTRYYLNNLAAGYTPTTWKGSWDTTTSAVTMKLGSTKSGASATSTIAEVVTTNLWDVALGRWVSDAFATLTKFTNSQTTDWVFGIGENSTSANNYTHVHIYITVGSTDSVRATLLANNIRGTENSTTAQGQANGTLTLSSAIAEVGDRLVVEIGYQAANTVTTSYSSTLYYGTTGSTDLASGSTSVTANPGWIDFTTQDPIEYDLIAASGTVALSGTPVTFTRSFRTWEKIGYLGVPQKSISSDYTIQSGDEGIHIFHPASDITVGRIFTIPANSSVPFKIGAAITFINWGAAISIVVTTDTLRKVGSGTTGTRTLNQYGMATAVKVADTEWAISGTNLL